MDKPVQQVCPHLAMKSDPTTSFAFPSKGNCCYHAKGRPTPEQNYQRTTCLTEQHLNCVVYKSPPDVLLPKNILEPRRKKKIQPKMLLWVLFVLILLVGAYLTYEFRDQLMNQYNRLLVPAWQQTQQALPSTLPITSTVTVTPTNREQPTATTTATATPEPTPSPTITKIPVVLALDTPIGDEIKFIIHRVQEGQAIGQYATRYNTTEPAIRAVNYNMPSVLLIDWPLVVPIDITDTTGLPALQPIEIIEGGITIEAFARQLGVDIDEISFYNHVDADRILQPGEWILVPRN